MRVAITVSSARLRQLVINCIQLQLTDPAAKSRDRIVKKSEKDGLYTALDLGSIWLERALAGK